ncbi:MAG: SBBP repeat-containing protein [Candidatus Brocadiia bacterium]
MPRSLPAGISPVIFTLLAICVVASSCSVGVMYAVNKYNNHADEVISVYGSGFWEWVDGMAVGPDGSVYSCGRAENREFNRYNAMVLKYQPDGKLVWQKLWGGKDWDWALGVAADSRSNVYTVGYTNSFGEGAGDGFVLKYSPEGKLLWQKTIGGESPDQFNAIAVDKQDNIYVAGRTKSFGAGSDDAFIARLNADGRVLWQKTWGFENWDSVAAIAVTPDNCLIAAGISASENNSSSKSFLLKLDRDGNIVFQKLWGNQTWNECISVTISVLNSGTSTENNGPANDFVIGMKEVIFAWNNAGVQVLKALDTLQQQKQDKSEAIELIKKAKGKDIGVQNLLDKVNPVDKQSIEIRDLMQIVVSESIEGLNLILGMLQGSNNRQDSDNKAEEAAKKISDANDKCEKMVMVLNEFIDSNNLRPVAKDYAIYVAGSVLNESYDTYLLKYDAQGGLLWQRCWGGAGTDWAKVTVAAPDGTVYMVGRTDSFTKSGYDAFVLKYAADGVLMNQSTWGGSEWDCFDAMTVRPEDASYEVYLGGGTENVSGHWRDAKGPGRDINWSSADALVSINNSDLVVNDAGSEDIDSAMELIKRRPDMINWNVLFIKYKQGRK